MKVCYQLVKHNGLHVRILGTFTEEPKAEAAMNAYPLNSEEDEELTVEEWPTDELASKFNVIVVASRS